MSNCFSIYLDGKFLPPQNIISFRVSVSMKFLLPIGELKLNDKGGTFISTLNARVGSTVNAFLSEGLLDSDGKEPKIESAIESKNSPKKLVPLVICRIQSDNSNAQDTLGGTVVLSLAHPWSIFKSYTNHAYPPTTVSETIKTVIEDKTRGYQIDVGIIDLTDDTAGTPRYKCGIPDDEFIQQILAPFAMSDSHPTYSYIDDIGKYNLRTFENIYKDEAITALVPNQVTWIDISEEYCETYPSIENVCNYDSLSLDIGGQDIRDMLSSLSPKVFFEDTISGSIKSGVLRKSFLFNDSNYLPINKTIMDLGPISNGYMYMYRTMEDSVGLMYNSTRVLNELITLHASSTFCGPELSIGKSVNLCVLSTDKENPNSMHWLSGKYVVTDKTYYSEGEMLEAKILTTISKPVVEIKNSTILSKETLYVGN